MLEFLTKAKEAFLEARAAAKYAAKYKSEYADRVAKIMDDIIENQKVDGTTVLSNISKTAPFKMKKGESFLFSINATLGTYKNDGRVSYGGLTGSIRVAKGVRFRVGSGRIAMGKSWVFDNPGTLHVTTDRIIFDGATKNVNSKLDKIIKMGIDPNEMILTVDRETGGDWWFRVDQWPTENEMAGFFMFQRGLVSAE